MKGIQHEEIVKELHKAKEKAVSLNESIVLSIAKEVEHKDPLLFYSFAEKGATRFFWQNALREEAIVGIGLCKSLISTGEAPFQEIRDAASQLITKVETVLLEGDEEIYPIFFGGFSFYQIESSLWKGFNDGHFILPKFTYFQQEKRAYFIMNIELNSDTSIEEIYSEFNQMIMKIDKPLGVVFHKVDIHEQLECKKNEWIQSVKELIHQIKEGNVEKVVAAREIILRTARPIDSVYVLRQLQLQQSDCFIFSFEMEEQCFLGATPERLIRTEKNQIETMALAGTVKCGQTTQENEMLEDYLLNDRKNIGEHQIVVQMIVDELGEMVKNIRTGERPSILKTRYLNHLYTPIEGEKGKEQSIFQFLECLHPTPALGGYPKDKAMKLIKEIEPLDRGWYGAPIGWFNTSGDGDFAVGIRSGLIKGTTTHLFAGCGIVRESDPIEEYNETKLKFTPMLAAIKGE